MVIVGVVEHGEKNQKRYQQVRHVDGEQDQALALRPRPRMLRLGEIVEQDVRQDSKQSGGDVGGVDNRGSSYPSAATWRAAERKRSLGILERVEFTSLER